MMEKVERNKKVIKRKSQRSREEEGKQNEREIADKLTTRVFATIFIPGNNAREKIPEK